MAKKSDYKKPIYDVNWYDDKYQSIVVFRNWMLLITLISIAGIFLMTLASYYFVPLKSVSPFVIQIDEKSGVTEVVDSKTNDEFTSNEALIRYFAHRYIVTRESYNFRTFQDNWDVVRLLSHPDVFKTYKNEMADENGMPRVFGAQTERKIAQISSQVKTNKTTGEISVTERVYVTETTTQRRPLEYTMIINLICYFDSLFNLTDEERLVNPLGFKVVYYNAEKENK
jgi:type IV secretion system protein VirB8